MTDVNLRGRLLLGTAGWERDGWTDSYYPHDLPDDWRLAYYANDCDGVLLTPADWRDADAVAFAEMLDDTPASFRCFVQLPHGAAQGAAGFLGHLDARRTVLLVDRCERSFDRWTQWVTQGGGRWHQPDGGAALVRWVLDDTDLRAWRARAEVLDPQVRALFLDGPAAHPGRVRELRMLLEMMARA